MAPLVLRTWHGIKGAEMGKTEGNICFTTGDGAATVLHLHTHIKNTHEHKKTKTAEKNATKPAIQSELTKLERTF